MYETLSLKEVEEEGAYLNNYRWVESVRPKSKETVHKQCSMADQVVSCAGAC